MSLIDSIDLMYDPNILEHILTQLLGIETWSKGDFVKFYDEE